MKLTILLLCTALLGTACKADEAAVRDDAPAQTVGEPEPTTQAETRFTSLVAGATQITVSELPADPSPSFGGTPRTVRDAAWIADFVAKVGDAPAIDAVPRCLPKYMLEFVLPDGKTQKFTAVCSGASEAVFVAGGESFAAQNPAEVQQMLADLADAPSD